MGNSAAKIEKTQPVKPSKASKTVYEKVKASYTQRKARSDRNSSFFLRHLVRPVSMVMTVPFVHLGLSANQVTSLRLIFLVLSAVCFSTGEFALAIVAGLYCCLDMFLDCVDGNLARMKKSSEKIFGDFLDSSTDVFRAVIIPLAIGHGLYSTPDLFMKAQGWGSKSALIVGYSVGLLILTRWFVFLRIRFAELKRTAQSVAAVPDEKPNFVVRGLDLLVRTDSNVTFLLLPVFVFTQSLSLFLAFRLSTTVLSLLLRLRWAFYQIRLFDK